MNGKVALDKLDPNKTALVVVHMVKGVVDEVDTPFNRLFQRRAKENGVITAQLRLLDGFRKAKVVYTAVPPIDRTLMGDLKHTRTLNSTMKKITAGIFEHKGFRPAVFRKSNVNASWNCVNLLLSWRQRFDAKQMPMRFADSQPF